MDEERTLDYLIAKELRYLTGLTAMEEYLITGTDPEAERIRNKLRGDTPQGSPP